MGMHYNQDLEKLFYIHQHLHLPLPELVHQLLHLQLLLNNLLLLKDQHLLKHKKFHQL
jgi:hypothetical protein